MGGDDLFSEGFESHAGEEGNEDNYDGDGHDSSCGGGVLYIFVVAQKLTAGEEIDGSEEFAEASKTTRHPKK